MDEEWAAGCEGCGEGMGCDVGIAKDEGGRVLYGGCKNTEKKKQFARFMTAFYRRGGCLYTLFKYPIGREENKKTIRLKQTTIHVPRPQLTWSPFTCIHSSKNLNSPAPKGQHRSTHLCFRYSV